MNDYDICRIIYFLGFDDGCRAKFCGDMIYKGAVENKVWSKTYLREVAYTENLAFHVNFDERTINYMTGKAKMKISLSSGTVGYSYFPVDLAINDLRFGITYQFKIDASDIYDETKLFDPCCWGDLNPATSVNCSADVKQLPHSPDPTLDYGKAADILRQNG
jgi:hypothetical protein